MFCTPPATTRSCVPDITRLGGEVHGLLGGAALAVDGGAGHVLGEAGDQPAGAGDVARLRADAVDVAEHHVVDGGGVDAGPLDERLDRVGRRDRRGAPATGRRPGARRACGPLRRCRPRPWRSLLDFPSCVTITDDPWPNRPWLAVTPTRRALHLAAAGLAPQLPGDLAHLGDGLGGDGLAEAGEPAARVHRDAAADRGVARAQQRLGLALLAQADVLVPVELERGGEVVDLGQARGPSGPMPASS